MPHNENQVGKITADSILLTEQINETTGIAKTTSGLVKLSGAKLYISNGSDFKLVTSA